MPRLFSYCIPFDEGGAPNPFWGICTLNICKPVIRRNAAEGDWIVATGSTQFNLQNKVVYAMKVTNVLTMQEYQNYCIKNVPTKIPDWNSKDYRKRVGDCIYDFTSDPPRILKSVHNEGNRKTDLGGRMTLLSDHFYYFGEKPIDLPIEFYPIVKQGQGHKSNYNDPFLDGFVRWIESLSEFKNKVNSEPYQRGLFMNTDESCLANCAIRDKELDEKDEELEKIEKVTSCSN